MNKIIFFKLKYLLKKIPSVEFPIFSVVIIEKSQ